MIKWEGKEIKENNRVEISKRKAYEGYPTGIGSATTVTRKAICAEGKLVELSKDSVKGKEVSCNIAKIRSRIVCLEKRAMEGVEVEGGWRNWKGKTVKNIYTDGSWKEVNSVRSMMVGGGKVQAGGAIVLAGDNWYSPLYVEMDLDDTEGAFQVETISLLGGCLIGEDKK